MLGPLRLLCSYVGAPSRAVTAAGPAGRLGGRKEQRTLTGPSPQPEAAQRLPDASATLLRGGPARRGPQTAFPGLASRLCLREALRPGSAICSLGCHSSLRCPGLFWHLYLGPSFPRMCLSQVLGSLPPMWEAFGMYLFHERFRELHIFFSQL